MSWRRFFRRKRADADLKGEIEGYLAEEIAENMARGMAAEEARVRRGSSSGIRGRARDTVAAKHDSAAGHACPRPELCGANAAAHAGLLADRDRRDGLVHRRHDIAVHGGALGAAQAASFSRSGPAGDDL